MKTKCHKLYHQKKSLDLITSDSEYTMKYKVHTVDVNYKGYPPFKQLFIFLICSFLRKAKNHTNHILLNFFKDTNE